MKGDSARTRASEEEAAAARARGRRNARIVLAVLAGIVVVILLLLLRRCNPPGDFDYFAAKAAELGRDPTRCSGWVRDKVATLDYAGDVKGPLGTLWNGAGSPEEKLALEVALRDACHGPRAPVVAAGPTAGSSGGAPPLRLRITHRAVLSSGEARETAIADAPIGAFVGDVHSIETLPSSATRVQLRSGARALVEADAKGASREEIVFAMERPSGQEPLVVVRELWAAGNRVGADRASAGDRHDFAVLPCRVGKYVLEKEDALLTQRGRKDTPEAEPYRRLLEWAEQSDDALARVERAHKVRARFDTPRILILSTFASTGPREKWPRAFDLRQDRVGLASLSGDAGRAMLATEARSLFESGLEHRFVERLARRETTSAYDVFARLSEDRGPTNPAARVKLAGEMIEALSGMSADAEAALSVAGPRGPTVTASRAEGGIRIRGPKVAKAFRDALAKEGASPLEKAGDGPLDIVVRDEISPVAIEAALLGADVTPPVEIGYALAVALRRGTEALVAPGTRVDMAWGEGKTAVSQRATVYACETDLDVRVRVETADGSLPVVARRTISAKAMEGALVHDPWYTPGQSASGDATSLAVSRAARAALLDGKPVDLALLAPRPDGADPALPRTVDRRTTLAHAGKGTVRAQVNGRAATLSVIRAKMSTGGEITILDDPRVAIGKADAIRSLTAPVRGRLVATEDGAPLAGARIGVAPRGPKAETLTALVLADGSFRLPPPPLEGYGKVTLVVTRERRTPVEVEVDLTAPGLEEVVVRAPRGLPDLLWITRSNAGELEPLTIPESVKRHARRDIEAGRLVIVPTRLVDDGGIGAIGYFAHDPGSGYVVGITEDGLCGATAWSRAAESALENVQAMAKDALEGDGPSATDGASVPFHMLRGAIVAYWQYCSARLEGQGHAQAIIATLEALEKWVDLLDITHFSEAGAQSLLRGGALTDAGADKAASELAKKLNALVQKGTASTDNDAAKTGFKLGYLGATLSLAIMLDEGEE